MKRVKPACRISNQTCFQCVGSEEGQDRIWRILGESELSFLNGAKKHVQYEAGTQLFSQGNPCNGIYCVETGCVGVRRLGPEGESVLTKLVLPGETLGYRASIGGGAHPVSAELLEAGQVCFIPKKAFDALLKRNPSLMNEFFQRVIQDLDFAEKRLLHLSTLPVRTRLSHLLLDLKESCASVNDSGCIVIKLPLARQDMAELLGTRPETIARAIKALINDGVASFTGRKVVVDDLDRLLDEVEPRVAAF